MYTLTYLDDDTIRLDFSRDYDAARWGVSHERVRDTAEQVTERRAGLVAAYAPHVYTVHLDAEPAPDRGPAWLRHGPNY